MLRIGNKCFMNIQEAVAWLLKNNWLPFQANVNFVANTDINLSDIIGTAPVNLKVGSLVLFQDLKVGTVTQVDVTTFQVAQEYVDFRDGINCIDSVEVDNNGHLIVVLTSGETIDAGSVYYPTKLEDIEDSNGHKRFIQGNGSPLVDTGVNITYCKWSLSGTHLMMVIAGVIDYQKTLGSGTTLGTFILPAWIRDKIYPVKTQLIEYKTVDVVDDAYQVSQMKLYVDKTSTSIIITTDASYTGPGINNAFRVSVDLLIDND